MASGTSDSVDTDLAKRLDQAEAEYKLKASEMARDIILDAMMHGATDYTAEYTVSTITLPNENVKGSVIGQGGRNIAAFERATGVEIEIEEGNTIRLSSFDSIRREIARRSLEILIRDGRITPNRIEEVVSSTQKQMDQILVEEGKNICATCGVYNLDPELVKIIGRYRFRFSYGQNLGIHTIEETKIGVQIAHELGLSEEDIQFVRLGCLLHDIGKVVTEEEGTHVQLGVELLKKFGLPEPVISAVAEHHEDKPFSSFISRIVWIADAISGSRPGARYEPHETYVKRMKVIEEIGRSFPGVLEVFAFQSGRDVRVVVKPDQVSDSELTLLISKIRERLEKEAQYAGQIKITGIREVRATDITKAK
ncbi:MAG: HDIG domain-containing protein [bacterium]|nr:HDIG domain-containing protein [bacterium]